PPQGMPPAGGGGDLGSIIGAAGGGVGVIVGMLGGPIGMIAGTILTVGAQIAGSLISSKKNAKTGSGGPTYITNITESALNARYEAEQTPDFPIQPIVNRVVDLLPGGIERHARIDRPWKARET